MWSKTEQKWRRERIWKKEIFSTQFFFRFYVNLNLIVSFKLLRISNDYFFSNFKEFYVRTRSKITILRGFVPFVILSCHQFIQMTTDSDATMNFLQKSISMMLKIDNSNLSTRWKCQKVVKSMIIITVFNSFDCKITHWSLFYDISYVYNHQKRLLLFYSFERGDFGSRWLKKYFPECLNDKKRSKMAIFPVLRCQNFEIHC